ncbi:methyltransferase, FkbM family [Rhizobium aethiopicum]|uniref:Methyltransferase, FkbM family n=1 Tax=Rhizobium aethiopicum TaxID=1138170 RepID=A0A1C3YCX0_9HYPH|nr:FkbM family methyltransferase [Rhizobium aethiopicum]SCB62341.1 methyltransferase, FkbM family [Rhizobium aethiopicum]
MITRFKKLRETLRWLTPLAGGPVAAARIIIRRKKNPLSLLEVKYDGKPLFFRGIDSNAIVEVLHEREYEFLDADLLSADSPRVLDVGAHIGTFAAWALRVNPHANILSVEADIHTFAVATKNASSRHANWRVINFAASSADGKRLRFSTAGPSMSHRVSSEGDLEVQTITLQTLMDTIGNLTEVDILKIDIEGSEEDFLCANPELLASVKCLVIELHPGICDTERVRKAISSHFKIVAEVPGRRSDKPLLLCRK